MKKLLAAAIAIVGAYFVMTMPPLDAEARSVSEAYSFTEACSAGTTTKIQSPVAGQERYSQIRCMNTSSTAVYIGASNTEDSATGYPICTGSGCIDAAISVETISPIYCEADGSITITCIAGTF